MAGGVTDKDMGMSQITAELKKFAGSYVKVGILENAGQKDGVDVAEYATWNENGVMGKNGKWKIPPRPFVKGWSDTEKTNIEGRIKNVYGRVAAGEVTAEKALETIGQYGKTGIQGYIRRGNFTPDAPATIKAKGSSTPLIDTGTLRNSVNYEVSK